MSTIRVARRKKFTSVDRAAVNDSRLSFRARGVLVWLLDKPDDWRTTAEKITAAGKEGRDATRAALRELETIGYLARRKWQDSDDGKWHTEWTVRERPAAVEPAPESSSGAEDHNRFPGVGEPPTENGRRFSSPLTEDEEPKTDLGALREKADPECPSCQGRGSITVAYGGTSTDQRGMTVQSASTRPCDCTLPPLEWNDPDPYQPENVSAP